MAVPQCRNLESGYGAGRRIAGACAGQSRSHSHVTATRGAGLSEGGWRGGGDGRETCWETWRVAELTAVAVLAARLGWPAAR